jgi:hypothetical protein
MNLAGVFSEGSCESTTLRAVEVGLEESLLGQAECLSLWPCGPSKVMKTRARADPESLLHPI